jgi:hypothetical protein
MNEPTKGLWEDLPSDFHVNGPIFFWDSEQKKATVTFTLEVEGRVYQRVFVLSEVKRENRG